MSIRNSPPILILSRLKKMRDPFIVEREREEREGKTKVLERERERWSEADSEVKMRKRRRGGIYNGWWSKGPQSIFDRFKFFGKMHFFF